MDVIMGLFDFFGRKTSTSGLAKHAARAANKRAQNPDRWQSLRALGEMKTPEAVEGLLQRFTFRIDPSITDQEEKDLAMEGILGAGDAAIEPVRAFLRASESIAWPVKMLQQLVSSEELVTDLLGLLENMGTDYERDPQRKVDAIMQLEELDDPRITPAVVRFFEDSSESARFHAVQTVVAQANADEARDALLELGAREESVRVRVRILDAVATREWSLGDDPTRFDALMPPGFVRDGDKVRKK